MASGTNVEATTISTKSPVYNDTKAAAGDGSGRDREGT